MNRPRLPGSHGQRGAPEAGHPEAGYTLVEMAVATVVTGLVVAVATAAYLAGARALTRWERDLALDADVHLAEAALARDLLRAEAAAYAGPDSLVLTARRGGRGVVWAVRDSALYRDTVRVHGPEVRTVEFTAASDRGLTGPLADDAPAAVHVRFALRGRDRTVRRGVTHAWRTPGGWPETHDP